VIDDPMAPIDLRPFVRFVILVACLFGIAPRLLGETPPNIVVILADDMGFSDIGCYGSEIETPNLDALAAGGVRFTQFYNTGRCCPTRASLLTGLYPHQAGIGHMMDDRGHNAYRGDLSKNALTIAEVLRSAGYRNYVTGKWHVTKVTKPKNDEDKHNWPLQRGFDRFYGTIHGAGSLFDPNTLTRDNQYISPFHDPEYPTEDYYYTDAISEHAVRYIQDHSQEHAEKPFFLYVAYTAAHWPMHARSEAIKKFEGRYDAGYQAVRDARYERMVSMGLVDRNQTVNTLIEDKHKETEFFDWDKRNMEVFAAMIDSMDQGIGRVVEALKATGKLENTLVLYLQDNGGCQEGMGRGKVGTQRGSVPSLAPLAKDYLQPDMIPKQTRDGYPMRQGKNVMAGPADTYIGYGYGWAGVSNTPFRLYKHFVHEGGISTPLIAHWPKKIERRGELERTPGHLIDIMATCVDIAGAKYPKEYKSNAIQPLEGRSLMPTLRQESIRPRPLFWEHEGNRALRIGDYKLVAEHKQPWELYDIVNDRSEQKNLVQREPERAAELQVLWEKFADRVGVVDYDELR
jgi:arylsulfatase